LANRVQYNELGKVIAKQCIAKCFLAVCELVET